MDNIEKKEWIESLDYILKTYGKDITVNLLKDLKTFAVSQGIKVPFSANTPYINTIPVEEQVAFPGDIEMEKRIRSIIRWNASVMVTKANKKSSGIGGHIASYASAATLYEVGFNHFFRGRTDDFEGDLVYIQGHSSPGIYARAFLEGRITEKQLNNFRRELAPGGGISSYPHPWLMPDFWQFPTVSMGLGPLMAIYQARFKKYLENRGLKKATDSKVWAFLGDGETDEVETLGAISLARRENLNNLIFVINCNLQRLDGPVRGNGSIIQELEGIFKGAGWNVIKVVWGNEWDILLKNDKDGILLKRMNELIDGEAQKYVVEGGAYIRKHFWGKDPELLKMVEHYTDEQLAKMRRGGHEAEKVYNAYKQAFEYKDGPTVILTRTIKGYGMSDAGEARNIAHQQKKLNEDELKRFRTRFGIPLSDEEVEKTPFYRPDENSPEMQYLRERRAKLGGYIPARIVKNIPFSAPKTEFFSEFYQGSNTRELSSTMAFVTILSKLMKNKEFGKQIVPIVPDEARTFGMEGFFRQFGIYSSIGQLYEPVDSANFLYYKEAKDGQLLEEGITEAGSMASFIAAATSYANYGINTIPFFIYYSMFGFQRVGDLAWAAGDIRAKGFMIGGTSGRTTLAGEGLQHQDGHNILLAYSIPNLMIYDPTYAYELAVIIEDGIKRMYEDGENKFYYITIMNENYEMPSMPENSKEGILKGLYRFKKSELKSDKKAHLFGSGTILNEVRKAAEILEKDYLVSTDIWSLTSYKNLHIDALECERLDMLEPDKDHIPYIKEILKDENGVFVTASDYVQILGDSISKYFPGKHSSLGTYGFGRSEDRTALRDFFEVSSKFIVFKTLNLLYKDNKISLELLNKAMKDLEIDINKKNPFID